jgi:HPt (histidine-containing phosphotransfer) domain-containing protein
MDNANRELDKEFLNSYYKDMINEVGEIFQLFLEETPKDVENVKKSFEENNFKQAAEGLHKIAPCFYNVGLPQLTTMVQQIEASIHASAYDEAKAKMNEFETLLTEYLPAIKEEHKRLLTFQ